MNPHKLLLDPVALPVYVEIINPFVIILVILIIIFVSVKLVKRAKRNKQNEYSKPKDTRNGQ